MDSDAFICVDIEKSFISFNVDYTRILLCNISLQYVNTFLDQSNDLCSYGL